MKKYSLAGGGVITDEELERRATQFEAGTWEGTLSNIRVGRPRGEEKLIPVTVRLPESMLTAIDTTNTNRSDYIRRVLATHLAV